MISSSVRTCTIITTFKLHGMLRLLDLMRSNKHLLLGSYYTYCTDFWWIVLFIFIPAFLLYVQFEKKVDHTVNFHYYIALLIICTVLKKQACNNYKYWSYNRNLRVLYSSKFSANHMYQTYNKYMDYISAFTLLSIFIRIT